MRKLKRLLSAAVAVIMLGSSFSGSVNALEAENADAGNTSAVLEATDTEWTADTETSAAEEPETKDIAEAEAVTNAEEADTELSDVQIEDAAANPEQDETAPIQNEETTPADKNEQGTEDVREDIAVEETDVDDEAFDEPMDRYTAGHGTVIKRELLVPVSINITNTWDDVRFQEGYFNGEGSLEACIRDADGKYVIFNENNEYSGVSDEMQSFAINNANKIYLPEGDYTLSFKDENTEELAGRHILGSYEDFVDDYDPIKLRYNSQINAREEGSGINVVAVKLRTDLHFFNISPAEEPPARIKLSAKDGDSYNEEGYYKYTRTEEGSDVIYTYDMENGTEDWINLDPGKKTIVRDTPHGQARFDIIFPVTGWKYVFGFGKSGGHLYKTENNGDLWIADGTSLTQSSSFIVATVDDLFAVKTYHKYTATKSSASAEFCLTTGVDKDDKKYVLDHYDTYEYNGRHLVNVYIPRRETKNLDDNSENTLINTGDNGEFTILYPAMMYDTDGNRSAPDRKFYLCETDSERGTFADNKYTVFTDRTDLNDYIWKIYNKKTGEEINSMALRQSDVIDLSADDFEVRETATQEQRNRLNLGTQRIRNLEVPYIEKIVPQGYIPKETEYLVDLYRHKGSGLEKIATVPIKAGEKKYLIPEEIEGLTYEDMRGFYIEEQAPEGWTAKYEGNVSYNQNAKKHFFNGNALYSENPHITITNTRTLYGLVIMKNVENGEGKHTHRFKVKVWDEIDGKKYPLVGLDLAGHTTDENGEAYFDITTNGENQSGIGMGVPYGSHYKIEEISSTLGKYTVSKTNDTGIITGSITQSVWTNSTNPCDVVVSKTDINGHEIAGAQMKVTGRADGEDTDIEPITWTSVEGQDKTIQLYPGTYILHEEAAPGSGEYVTASDITFVVKRDGTVTIDNKDVDKVTMVDGYAPVELELIKFMLNSYKEYTSTINVQFWSEEGGQRTPLAGYTVPDTDYVTDDEGRLQVNITTDAANSDGRITLKLPKGTHYRVEEADPADPNVNFAYALKNSQKLGGASAEGILTRKDSIKFDNIMYSYVEIEKVDQNGSYMPGAVMQILDSRGTVVKEWTTTGAKDTVYLKPSIGANYNAPQYYVLHEKTKPGNAVNTAADIRFMVIPGTQEKGQLLAADGNIFKPAEKLSIRNIDRTKTHSLTISKEYDDNGTGVILADDIEFAFHVLIKNLPVEYMQAGLDVEEAYIGEFEQGLPLPRSTGGPYGTMYSYRPAQKTDHVAGWDGMIRHNFDYEEGGQTAYASFVIWIKPGESVTIKDLPEGAAWEIFEMGSNKTSVELFDVRYEPTSGTINGADAAAAVTNVQKTIDFKLKKDIYGYDDGTVFYVEFRSDDNTGGGSYKELNQTFTGSDGQERAFFHEDGQFRALIPFRPEDGEMVIKLPVQVHWFINERVPARGVDMDDYTYEDLIDLVFHNNSILENPVLYTCAGQDSDGIMDYAAVAPLLTSGTNRTQDFYAHYQNRSAVVAFDKKDSEGMYLPGAHMAVIDKETEEIVEEWVTDGRKPHTWNISGYVDGSGYKTFEGKQFILRELDAPEGYQKADDIEFTLRAHVDTTTSWSNAFEDMPRDVEYFYPYMDTGDGQEKLLLTMVDSCAPHDVVISKTDISGHEIAGAQMKVTGREEGASADITPITWISEDGKDKTIRVRPGTYTLHEEAAPESGIYVKASDITFTVDKDGKVKVDGKDVSKVTMVDEYNVSSLKVKKTVTGSFGSRDKQFEFSAVFTKADGTPYTKAIHYKKGSEEGTLTPDAAGKVEFTLSHGDEIEFSGIVYGTKYRVTEKDYSSLGYTTTSENASGTVTSDMRDVKFVNENGTVVPTGNWLPGTAAMPILLAGAAAICLILYRKKKKN